MNRPSMSRFAAAAACMITCLTFMGELSAQQTKRSEKGPGGHPLAGRHGGLADLLEAPDWPAAPRAMDRRVEDSADHEWAPKEASVSVAAEEPLPDRPRINAHPLVKLAAADPNARATMQRLIDQRNQIIDRCDFFDTITEIKKEEVVLANLLQKNKQAAAVANETAIALQQVVALGDAGKQFVPAARNHAQRAHAELQESIRRLRDQQQKLLPLWKRIEENVEPWTGAYQEMRAWLVPDRRDPNRPAILEVLEAATARREDFYEGRVLAALARTYDGDAAGADRHLTAACAGFGRFGLYGAAWGADCCLAYLLLEQPQKVADYVASVRKLDAWRQTPLLCWLVGQAAMMEGKDNEAKTYYERALTRAGFRDPKQPPVPEPLLGDAARFYSTAKNDKVRDLDKAKELLGRAAEESETWQVLWARAAMLAAEGDYDAARRTFDACRERAPGTLDASLEGILSQSIEQTPSKR